MLKRRLAYPIAGVATIAASLFSAAYTSANAQSGVPGVSVVAPPPAGFDPSTASPQARAKYGIPPAPDPVVAPEAYRHWQRALSSPQNRTAPVLEHTNVYHGPAVLAAPISSETNQASAIGRTTSLNWSGSVVIDSGNPFWQAAIIGEFVVPTAHPPFGKCSDGWRYSSLWVGLDGSGSSDVLQAGVDVNAYCGVIIGGTGTEYYPWIEWFPNTSIAVKSLEIHPGDLVFVEVWSTTPTEGFAYFYNFSTLQTAGSYKLTAPKGTSLIGNSVEWIVERPCLSRCTTSTPVLASLTNYIDASWPYGVAWNYQVPLPDYYYMGDVAPTGELWEFEMVDDAGKGISFGTPIGGDFLYFQDYGSACGRSDSPPC